MFAIFFTLAKEVESHGKEDLFLPFFFYIPSLHIKDNVLEKLKEAYA